MITFYVLEYSFNDYFCHPHSFIIIFITIIILILYLRQSKGLLLIFWDHDFPIFQFFFFFLSEGIFLQKSTWAAWVLIHHTPRMPSLAFPREQRLPWVFKSWVSTFSFQNFVNAFVLVFLNLTWQRHLRLFLFLFLYGSSGFYVLEIWFFPPVSL